MGDDSGNAYDNLMHELEESEKCLMHFCKEVELGDVEGTVLQFRDQIEAQFGAIKRALESEKEGLSAMQQANSTR